MLSSLLSRKRPSRADFDHEVLPHLDSLYGTALRLTRSERDAEDLVQDTALRAFRFFHKFEAGSNARAWLFKILHNTFATKYRRRTRERQVLDAIDADPAAAGEAPIASAPPDPEDELMTQLLSDDVRRAIDRLPEEFRAAVVLCDLEDFSYREIADILECPVGTVMSRLHRGRRMLREALRGRAEAEGIARPEKTDANGERVADVIPLRHGGRREEP